MNNFLKLTTLALLSVVFFTSCEKDEDNEIVEPNAVSAEFEFTMEDAPFQYDVVYDINGVNVSFDEIRFYLSDFMLQDNASNVESLNTFLLIDAGASNNTFVLGNTELSNLAQLDLLLGLNDVVNHEDPITAAAPLNDASMHWGWNPASGYKFIKTECMVDTDGDGTPETPASIHCATNALSREITLTTQQNITSTSTKLKISADVANFFSGVDFTDLSGTHGSSPLTNSVADNVAASFEVVN